MPKFIFRTIRFVNKADAAQNNLANEQAQFYQTLIQSYQQQFGAQNAITNALTAEFEPILQAGPSQFGFSGAQTAELRTQADTGTAANYAQAQTATNNAVATAGGGNSFVPSGAQAQLSSLNANAAAGQRSSEQLGITQAGYAQGNANFNLAASALGGTAGLLNPTGYIGGANSAGSAAFNSATKINEENNAWKSTLAGILGGIGGAFLGNFSFGGGSGGGGSSASPVSNTSEEGGGEGWSP